MTLERIATSTGDTDIDFRIFRSIDGAVSIQVESSALQSLELLVRESTKAIRGHGVEMGGLIVGRPIDWKSRTLIMTGFVPVEIEYRFGPLFRTSESDVQLFKDAAAKVRGNVIGYFRSQLRSGMLVRESDLRLLGELFKGRDCCFAPIEATVNSQSVLSLHYLPATGDPLLAARFPLVNPRELQPAPESPLSAEPPKQEAVKPEVAAPPPAFTAAPQPRKSYRWIILLAPASLALVGIAFFLGKEFGSQSKTPLVEVKQVRSTPVAVAPPVTSLNLQIAALTSGVEISWNTAMPAVFSASRGLLVLFDGANPKRIELDASQVQSGAYSYPARSSKISAWLTIYQPNGAFIGDTKEVRLSVAPEAIESPSPASPSVSEQTPRNIPNKSAKIPTVTPLSTSPPPDQPDSRRSWAERTVPIREPLRAPELPPPPPISAIPTPVLQTPAIHVPPPSANPAMNYKGSVSPPVAATLVHQVSPSVPANLSSRLRTEVQLDIAVSIDPTGKVTEAHVVSSRGALAGLLAIEALKAAQFSRFTPAQENGRAVAGNAVLSYRFAPKPQ